MKQINLLDIDNDKAKCIICNEDLNTAKTYKLACCNREFHTHCIVTWFRHRPSNLEKGRLGGNCPICGDRGNNPSELKCNNWTSHTSRGVISNITFNEKKKLLYNYHKNHNGPKELTKSIEKYEIALKNQKDANKKLIEYRKYIKNNETIYSETEKKIKRLRWILWRKSDLLSKCENNLFSFGVIPIVVPYFIDIN